MRKLLSLLFNLFIIASVTGTIGHMFFYTGDGNMRVSGWVVFRYFTVDSNILAAVASAALILGTVAGLVTGSGAPRWTLYLKYTGTTAVTVTLVTVFLLLTRIYGVKSMLAGSNLYLHLLIPLAAIVSFVLLDEPKRLHPAGLLLSVLPTLLYGIVYLRQVVFVGAENGGWNDFYGFNRNGAWMISYAAMTAGTLLLALILFLSHNAGCRE